jgi:uncharacterized membrane protein YraQ (UPF0718 family)
MLFGMSLGALMLALFSLLPKTQARHPLAEVLSGSLIGFPLGVCANCAAPIAKGMLQAGNRPGVPMGLMFSSPTLNVLVITMTFSLLPVHFGLIKYGLLLVFLLGILPTLLQRFSGQSAFKSEEACLLLTSETWPIAIQAALKSFGQCFAYIMHKTVGWMILAGLAGVLLSHLIPLQAWNTLEPSLLTLGALAVLGVFLPVPIAVDVILAHTLYLAGLPDAYVMVLLFTLGTYSIIPFFILWTSQAKKLAIWFYGILAALGVISGLLISIV